MLTILLVFLFSATHEAEEQMKDQSSQRYHGGRRAWRRKEKKLDEEKRVKTVEDSVTKRERKRIESASSRDTLPRARHQHQWNWLF